MNTFGKIVHNIKIGNWKFLVQYARAMGFRRVFQMTLEMIQESFTIVNPEDARRLERIEYEEAHPDSKFRLRLHMFRWRLFTLFKKKVD